jgi:transposase
MTLTMTQHDRDRLKVIEQVQQGHLTQKQAGALLGRSERQVRRRLRRYEAEGDGGVLHRSRGRSSNRRLPAELRDQALALLRQPAWHDFGPTFAAEKLAQLHGLHVSREKLRRWMIEAQLWRPRRRPVQAHEWRERRACRGELVQWDTSEHDWFEGRGEPAVFINLVDDATSTLWGRFYPRDTSANNLRLLESYLRHYGRPVAVYTDKDSIFRVNRRADLEEQLAGREAETQVGRALRELDIELIFAHSPQAKGRVERSFGTLQDRLVKELRLAGIGTIAEANRFLEERFLPAHKARFAQAPACAVDAHRPVGDLDLAAILSHQETRVVTNDYTISYYGQRYQLARGAAPTGLRGNRVVVEQRLDGQLALRWRGHYLTCRAVPAAADAAPGAALVRGGPGAASPPARASQRRAVANKAHQPAPDHPWKQRYRTLSRCTQPDISTLR